jgi:hypothetical protein
VKNLFIFFTDFYFLHRFYFVQDFFSLFFSVKKAFQKTKQQLANATCKCKRDLQTQLANATRMKKSLAADLRSKILAGSMACVGVTCTSEKSLD